MKNVKVSIIMGVLNAQSRVIEAIESIQKQSFENWEFIICDDGSTDDTYNVVCEIAKVDKRIIPVKNEKNMGLARTLNKCIELSNGEYIARMDDDDYSYSFRLERQVDFLDNNKDYDFVSSCVDIYDGNDVTHKETRPEFPTKEDFMWNSPFVHPATMFRAQKLKQVGGYRFAKETRRAEDYDLFMRMYSQGMKGYNFQTSLLRYYVNQEAMKKRRYRYRIDEMKVRYKGFKLLNLGPKSMIYTVKPLIVGLIPKGSIIKLQKKYYKEKK